MKNIIVKIFIPVILTVTVFLCGCEFSASKKEETVVELPDYEYPQAEEIPTQIYVDLSSWQEDVDFEALKLEGVRGVMLRLSRYNMEIDERFDEYYRLAKEAGLSVGAYYFMSAQSVEEAEADAEKVYKLLKEGNYELELPLFYDIEDEHDGSSTVSNLGKELLTEIIITFCEAMLEKNIYAGYYSNLDFAQSCYNAGALEKYPYWAAAYSITVDRNSYKNLCMWQKSASGVIDGVDGEVDVDEVFRDLEGYIKDKGYNKLIVK